MKHCCIKKLYTDISSERITIIFNLLKKGLKLFCIVLPWFTAGIGFNPILDRIFKAIKAHEGLHKLCSIMKTMDGTILNSTLGLFINDQLIFSTLSIKKNKFRKPLFGFKLYGSGEFG